jgi:hypothetical protein
MLWPGDKKLLKESLGAYFLQQYEGSPLLLGRRTARLWSADMDEIILRKFITCIYKRQEIWREKRKE